MLNVNCFAFLEGILPTFQSYDWSDGTRGPKIAAITDWTSLPYYIVCHRSLCGCLFISWLLQMCLNLGVLPPLNLPTLYPSCLPPLCAVLTLEKQQNVMNSVISDLVV